MIRTPVPGRTLPQPSDPDDELLAEVDAFLGAEQAEPGPDLPLGLERALWREVADALGLPAGCTWRDCRRARRCAGPMGAIERAPSCLIGEDDAVLDDCFAEARERRAERLRRARATKKPRRSGARSSRAREPQAAASSAEGSRST
jgi:hypothetical protein